MTPYNATLSGAYDNLTPPGRNLSYWYSWGECDGYPTNAITTMTMSYLDAPSSAILEPVTLGSLEPQTQYCYQV